MFLNDRVLVRPNSFFRRFLSQNHSVGCRFAALEVALIVDLCFPPYKTMGQGPKG